MACLRVFSERDDPRFYVITSHQVLGSSLQADNTHVRCGYMLQNRLPTGASPLPSRFRAEYASESPRRRLVCCCITRNPYDQYNGAAAAVPSISLYVWYDMRDRYNPKSESDQAFISLIRL